MPLRHVRALRAEPLVDRIEDQVLPVVGTGMPGNDLAAAADDDLMDICGTEKPTR